MERVTQLIFSSECLIIKKKKKKKEIRAKITNQSIQFGLDLFLFIFFVILMIPSLFLSCAISDSEVQDTTNPLTGVDLTIQNQIARTLDP